MADGSDLNVDSLISRLLEGMYLKLLHSNVIDIKYKY